MEYIIKVKLSDELLNQAERAAASLGMSADEYLRAALQEKVRRWAQGEDDKKEFDRIAKDLMERRREVYQRLAQ